MVGPLHVPVKGEVLTVLAPGPRSHENHQEGLPRPDRKIVSWAHIYPPYSRSRNDACSYPRLTLDFHTNKRIIDEVVRCLHLGGVKGSG